MTLNIIGLILSAALFIYGVTNLLTHTSDSQEGLSASNTINSMEHPEGKQVNWYGEWISLDEARSKGLDTSNLNGGGNTSIYVVTVGQGGLVNEAGYTKPDAKGKVYYYPPNGGLGGLVDIKPIIYVEDSNN